MTDISIPSAVLIGHESRLPGNPYRTVALATVLQAVRDTRKGDVHALAWLAEDAPTWLDACGVEFGIENWFDWVLSGCPECKNNHWRTSAKRKVAHYG